MAGIFYSNGINVYDLKDPNIYDIPELTFFTDMAYNVYYKGRKSIDIPSDAAEVSEAVNMGRCKLKCMHRS